MPVTKTTNLQTLATNATLQRTEFDAGTFVEALRRNLMVTPLGRRNDIPRNQGTTMRWQYFSNPSAVQTALVEGADPSNSRDIDATAVTATIATWGAYFELSDIFEIATISGTRQEFVKAAGYQAALTLDELCLEELQSASNVVNAGSALKASDLNAAARTLAQGNRSTGAGGAKFHPATPGGRFYCGVFSPEACYDLVNEGSPTWYQAKAQAFEDNLTTPMQETPASAAVHNVMVKMTENIQRDTSASPDDDLNYVLGKDAFGVTSLASNILNPEVNIVPASPSLASPLGMRSTIGWKVRFARETIDTSRFVEVLSDATGVGA
jgi:N4-gp56 family major capsid protein